MNHSLMFGACHKLKAPAMTLHLTWVPDLAGGLATGGLLVARTLCRAAGRWADGLRSTLTRLLAAVAMSLRLLRGGGERVWRGRREGGPEKVDGGLPFDQDPQTTAAEEGDVKMGVVESPPRAGGWYYFLADTVILFQHSARLKGGEGVSRGGEALGGSLGATGDPLGQYAAALGCSQKEVASACTNPIVLSLVCPPVDQESEWSAGEEVEKEEEEEEEEGSLEWLRESDEGELNDWCTDWEDDDDEEEDEKVGCEADDLWESFFASDDPYNPLNFSASIGPPPRRSPSEAEEGAEWEAEAEEGETTAPEEGTNDRTVANARRSETQSSHRRAEAAEPREEGRSQSDWDGPAGRVEPDCVSPVTPEVAADADRQSSKGKKAKCIKKVRFSPVVEFHPMVTWSFAYQAARKGPWEQYGRDRCRFHRRIAETETAIGRCFEQKHRDSVWAKLYAE